MTSTVLAAMKNVKIMGLQSGLVAYIEGLRQAEGFLGGKGHGHLRRVVEVV